jgi:choline-sulfatase
MAIRAFPFNDQQKQIAKNGNPPARNIDDALQLPNTIPPKDFYDNYCPPLPDNYAIQEGEAEAITDLIKETGFRYDARMQWTDDDWRLHRYVYCRLTELVDGEVQQVLDAIKDSGNEENTIVIFSSDHGDMDASHHLEHKSMPYEQAANIPFMVMWKGHIAPGRVDDTHLVSSGLDLLPTMCDYAGIKGIADPRGRSLRPLIEGKQVQWRKTIPIESETGSAVLSDDGLKFVRYCYELGRVQEQLFDLKADPGETKQFANDPCYADKLRKMRDVFYKEWFPGIK